MKHCCRVIFHSNKTRIISYYEANSNWILFFPDGKCCRIYYFNAHYESYDWLRNETSTKYLVSLYNKSNNFRSCDWVSR